MAEFEFDERPGQETSRASKPRLFVVIVALFLMASAIGGVSMWSMFRSGANDLSGATHAPSSVPSQAGSPVPEPSADGSGSVTVSATMREYRDAAEEMADELPDGYLFPEEYPQGTSYDMAPEGTGTVAALYYWRCAWTDQFFTDFDAKNSRGIERDLATLDRWTDFPLVHDDAASAAQDESQWRNEVIQPAREGHVSVLRTLGYSGCKEVVKDDGSTPPAPAL